MSVSRVEGILGEFRSRARRAPFSILVVRDVEEADPRVLSDFIPFLMERSRRSGSAALRADLQGTLLAFTLNTGTASCEPPPAEGKSEGSRRTSRLKRGREDLAALLPPGFGTGLRRIRLAPLSRATRETILDLALAPLVRRFQSCHGLDVVLTPAARRRLIALGFSPEEGARGLAETLRRHLDLAISRRSKADEEPAGREREVALQRLQEIRDRSADFDPDALEENVIQQTRVRVPYRRILVDESDGELRCLGEK